MSTGRVIFSSAEFRSVPFRSVPSFGIGSSAELGMLRNEQFLPRNNGSCSESIPRNFCRNEIPLPTLGRSNLRCGGGVFFAVLW
jgi:hypothetical protein